MNNNDELIKALFNENMRWAALERAQTQHADIIYAGTSSAEQEPDFKKLAEFQTGEIGRLTAINSDMLNALRHARFDPAWQHLSEQSQAVICEALKKAV